jgi:hypothetical protein
LPWLQMTDGSWGTAACASHKGDHTDEYGCRPCTPSRMWMKMVCLILLEGPLWQQAFGEQEPVELAVFGYQPPPVFAVEGKQQVAVLAIEGKQPAAVVTVEVKQRAPG